jgi:hypothetical protein
MKLWLLGSAVKLMRQSTIKCRKRTSLMENWRPMTRMEESWCQNKSKVLRQRMEWRWAEWRPEHKMKKERNKKAKQEAWLCQRAQASGHYPLTNNDHLWSQHRDDCHWCRRQHTATHLILTTLYYSAHCWVNGGRREIIRKSCFNALHRWHNGDVFRCLFAGFSVVSLS